MERSAAKVVLLEMPQRLKVEPPRAVSVWVWPLSCGEVMHRVEGKALK